MAGNLTFSMIKPYAVQQNYIGAILHIINEHGFKIKSMRMLKLHKADAENFYKIHQEKPFFNGLVEFMSSGPIVALILEKENAVEDFRKIIGNTNPEVAEQGTIRKIFGKSIEKNAVHGSDSDENALIEANFFFSARERY
ncbi:MAG: nucleoside-diphosphate kinase [Bacteroidota bacterium]